MVGVSSVRLTTAVAGLVCGPAYFLFGEAGRISDLGDGFQGMQQEASRRILQSPSSSDNSAPQVRIGGIG